MAELFVPSGSTAELPVAPEPYENVEPILEGAISEWDDAMQSKYGGLLIARPPFYVQGDYPIQGRSDWRWDPETYRYMHEDEDDIDADESRVLSELLSELMIEKGLAFLDRMLDRSIPIIEWVFEEYERLQRISLTQYLLGVGGALVLTGSMFGGLKDFLRKQFGFFENFARQIKDGLLRVKEIIRRAKMYWEAVKGRYSAGRARAHGIQLPAMPGDGSTECLSHCKCSWRLVDIDRETVHAYWTLGLYVKEHCKDCLRREIEWNPYVAKRGV